MVLWPDARMRLDDSIRMTLESLNAYGPLYDHWAISWSGGKDSTLLVVLVLWALKAGLVKRPKSLVIFYADTRLELTPLWYVAADIRKQIEAQGVEVKVVMAPLDKRFMVYIFGRGVPPPNSATLRWCTRQLKVDPMEAALRERHGQTGQKVLMLTGVRQGESAVRDGRIAMSCGRDGAECGQGWYQLSMPEDVCDTLAPLLHWRVCHVWDYLVFYAPDPEYGGWNTRLLANAYGGDEAAEKNARTGCVGCALVQEDRALQAVCELEEWSYLSPLKRLRELWPQLRHPSRRLRKVGGRVTQAGAPFQAQQPMGPLTLEARRWGLEQVLAIQAEVNALAVQRGRPAVDILNAEEEARIRELIAANTWPERWTGEEPSAMDWFEEHYSDGTSQPLLPLVVGSPTAAGDPETGR